MAGAITDLRMAVQLLPTPTSQAAKHGATPDTGANAHGYNLWDLPHLLPTPTARDGKGRSAQGRKGTENLPSAVTSLPSTGGPPSSDDQPRTP